LGYAQAEQERGTIVWQSIQPRPQFRGLPKVVTTSAPMYRTPTGELLYDMKSILDVYDAIIALAGHSGAPPETLKILRGQRDEFVRALG